MFVPIGKISSPTNFPGAGTGVNINNASKIAFQALVLLLLGFEINVGISISVIDP